MILISISSLLSCQSKKAVHESFAVQADVRLLKVIDEYIKVNKEFENNRLVTLTLINDRICQNDYSLASVNYILNEIYYFRTPSKYFEYNGRLCIIIDSGDALYTSDGSKKCFQELTQKYKLPIRDMFNESNEVSRLQWYISYSNDSLKVEKDGQSKDFSCDEDGKRKVEGLP